MIMADYEMLKLDRQLCFPLYAASREVIKRYYPLLEDLDLTYTQYVAMMVLWEEKEISVRDLGHRLFLDSGTLTPLLKRMEKKGLLTRHRSQKDERVVVVRITETGETLRDKAASVPEKMGACIPLEPQEAMELYRLLHKLLGGISQN